MLRAPGLALQTGNLRGWARVPVHGAHTQCSEFSCIPPAGLRPHSGLPPGRSTDTQSVAQCWGEGSLALSNRLQTGEDRRGGKGHGRGQHIQVHLCGRQLASIWCSKRKQQRKPQSSLALMPLPALCSARARSCQLGRAAVGLSQPAQEMGDTEQCLLCSRSWNWRFRRMECRAGHETGDSPRVMLSPRASWANSRPSWGASSADRRATSLLHRRSSASWSPTVTARGSARSCPHIEIRLLQRPPCNTSWDHMCARNCHHPPLCGLFMRPRMVLS